MTLLLGCAAILDAALAGARPSRGGALRVLGVAFLASAVLLTGLLAAGSASAQTVNDDGSKTIWSTTMTVGTNTVTTGTFVQVFTGFSSIPSFGSIGSCQITYSGTNYSCAALTRVDATIANVPDSDKLLWTMPSLFPTASDPKLVLELDGTKFPLADADRGTNDYAWSNHGLSWAVSDTVAVKLIELQAPTAPTNLTASAASATRINLSWSAPSKTGGSDITGYKIEVSTDGGDNWSNVSSNTGTTATFFNDTGLTTSCSLRTYRVSAINAIGTSPVSNTAGRGGTARRPAGAAVRAERLHGALVEHADGGKGWL